MRNSQNCGLNIYRKKMITKQYRSWLRSVSIIALPSGVFFILAIKLRSRTILYYDELFDIFPMKQLLAGCRNIYGVANAGVHFGCLPIMSGTKYQGVLRGLYFAPFIISNHLSVISFVFINSIIFGIVSYILYVIFELFFHDRLYSILSMLIVVCQPLLWTNLTFDLGPVGQQLLIRSLILVVTFTRLVNSTKLGKTQLILSGLLIYGKLDGIWFAVSLLMAYLIINSFALKSFMRDRITQLFCLGIAFASAYSLILARSQNPQGTSLNLFSKMLIQLPSHLSNGVSDLIVQPALPFTSFHSTFILFLSAIATLFPVGKVAKNRYLVNSYNLLRTTNLVTMIFIIVTPKATAPWHTVSLLPTLIIQIVLMIWLTLTSIASQFVLNKKMTQIVMSCILGVMLVFANLQSQRVYIHLHQAKLNPLFSKQLPLKMNPLLTNVNSKTAVIITSWGLYNSLVLDSSFNHQATNKNYVDAWPWFNNLNSPERKHFFEWVFQTGMLSTFTEFKFVGFSPSTNGTGPEFRQYISGLPLCKIRFATPLPIDSQSSLNYATAEKCRYPH